MIIPRRSWRRASAVLVALSAALVPAAVQPAQAAPAPTVSSYRTLPEPPALSVARDELAGLTVSEPHSMDGYSREKFPHWIRQYGQCDTREVVLARDGQDVVQDDQCRAVSGTWTSPYDGKVFSDAKQLDIDHLVPLAASWRSGADTWTTDKRKAFANDLTHSQLVAVSAASNRAKADKGPDAWRPPLQSYWCTYSRAWTDIKYTYGLSTTEPEKAALNEMLDTCAQ
ncbi:GmrSD restriction endonuclease domain-containing protein [Kitasatospora griseola]|uniref:GmrSD restriction endonuclease domain-containing protein n=1 Tax=Kitasatospora griseola TaxID=2064 RepID=UPI0037F43CEC